MTPILVREVASLVLRPRTSSAPVTPSGAHVRFGGDSEKKKAPAVNSQDQGRDNARYYGIITLNQVMLNKDQGDVAGKMIDVYFEVFGDVLGRLPEKRDEDSDEEDQSKEAAKEKGQKRKRGEKKRDNDTPAASDGVSEMDSKLVAAVLTGINRAFPFATIDDEAYVKFETFLFVRCTESHNSNNSFKQRLDTLFRITHTGTFNVSIQALLLIYHVSAAKRVSCIPFSSAHEGIY